MKVYEVVVKGLYIERLKVEKIVVKVIRENP